MTAVETAVHIRWMIRRDMAEVLAIESGSWDTPWTEEDFLRHLRQRNIIGMVAELPGDTLGGFMIYELHKRHMDLLNFAVHPEYRRQGIGSQLMRKLRSKMASHRKTSVRLAVREFRDGTLAFLWRSRFRIATPIDGVDVKLLARLPNGVAQDYLKDYGVEELRMEYRLQETDNA